MGNAPWEELLTNIRKKLFGWTFQSLNFVVPLTLLKLILQDIPLYAFSSFSRNFSGRRHVSQKMAPSDLECPFFFLNQNKGVSFREILENKILKNVIETKIW
jgi:hypothetical protein